MTLSQAKEFLVFNGEINKKRKGNWPNNMAANGMCQYDKYFSQRWLSYQQGSNQDFESGPEAECKKTYEQTS